VEGLHTGMGWEAVVNPAPLTIASNHGIPIMNARRLCFPILLWILLPAIPCPGQEAEEKDSTKYEIQEVVSVGTRTMERMIDIPYSVFRVDKKELGYGKKISAKDVLADVPGLFLQSRYGNHDLRISLRGFGTRSNSGVRGVRVLQDGIPESEPDGETIVDDIDFTSLATVEVVKGNLSSLYANAPGGVINFVSDLYFPKSFVASVNQAGRYGYRLNGVKVGLQNLANRMLVTYNYTNHNGFRAHSPEYHHLVNTIYETYPGQHSTLTILGNYLRSLNKLPGSLTREEFAADPFQANPIAVSQDFKRATAKGRLGIRYRTRLGETQSDEFEITAYGGVKELESTDNLAYRFTTRYSVGTMIGFTNRSKILEDRTNVLTVGMDYAFQAGPVTEFENINGVKGVSVDNEYYESLSNVGFYVSDRLEVLPERLDLLVSGRLDRNGFVRDIRIPYGFTDTTRSFQRFAPKIGLNYKLTPSIAAYSSYGLSYDFPALSEMANTPLSSSIRYSINPDLGPQRSRNFELGVKGNLVKPDAWFMRKIFFDVTWFTYLVEDEIVPFVINQQSYYRNTASTRRSGVEVGVKTHPFEGVELTVNYVFMHFRYRSYPATVFGPSGTVIEDYSRNPVPSIPRQIVNFILNYELEISDDVSGLLQWDCDYIDRMSVNDRNSETSAGYFYGNMMAGANFGLLGMSATAYVGVNNIFDRRYAGFININEYYNRYYDTGEPRMFYAGLKLTESL
jgi:iron complex outermembrane receptor protein